MRVDKWHGMSEGRHVFSMVVFVRRPKQTDRKRFTPSPSKPTFRNAMISENYTTSAHTISACTCVHMPVCMSICTHTHTFTHARRLRERCTRSSLRFLVFCSTQQGSINGNLTKAVSLSKTLASLTLLTVP